MMMPGGADEECYRQFLMLLEDTVCHEVHNLQVYIGVGTGLIVNEIEVKIITILVCNQ